MKSDRNENDAMIPTRRLRLPWFIIIDICCLLISAGDAALRCIDRSTFRSIAHAHADRKQGAGALAADESWHAYSYLQRPVNGTSGMKRTGGVQKML